jgi:hypothetical protein
MGFKPATVEISLSAGRKADVVTASIPWQIADS